MNAKFRGLSYSTTSLYEKVDTMKFASFIVLMTFTLVAKATTWGESEVDDPILEGEKCSVHEPASYGGYIYRWPSKYDQVFWPLTDHHGIWFCEKSGFTAFIGDFSDLNPDEIETIKEYLVENHPKDSSIETKLTQLEKIYSLRNTDKDFNNKLLRVLARWHQDLGNTDKANKYRREAFVGVKQALQTGLDEIQNLEYLYLAANYSRQFGDIKGSDDYISKLVLALDDIKNEKSKGFAEYLKELYPDTIHIKSGGILDPEITE